MEDAGLAGGLQATAGQFGGVLGASVLGSVIASRAASVLPTKLATFGVQPGTAHRLLTNTALIAQGLSAGTRHTSPRLEAAIRSASHAAFMSGFHVALALGGAVALVGAGSGLFIRAGVTSSGAPVHL
jgi:hypothetical protein